jgi:translation initiation factor IF-3
MRVIDETGQNVGILSKSEALQHAQSKGLDLIEIAPGANPPVARIISYDKFRYQQKKEEKKKQQKGLELKQVRLSARSADNDLAIKAKKVNEFLEKGHVVEIFLRLRGREKYNREWATERLRHFTAIIGDTYRVLSPQTFSMQGIIMQIAKKQ